MTRVEFLTELDRHLSVLSKEEADEHLSYYAEMLADRMEDGMSEEDAVASLESPGVIARRILGAAYTAPRRKNHAKAVAVVAVIIVAVLSLTFISGVPLLAMLFGFNASVSPGVGYEDVVIQEMPVDECTILIPADGIRSLKISWMSGNVFIEVWEDSEIGIFEVDQVSVQHTLEGNTLSIGYEDRLNSGTGDLTVYLPRELADSTLDLFSIDINSGDVYCSGVNAAALQLYTISGCLDVTGCFGDVRLTSTSGDVSVYGSAETITAELISGGLFLCCDYRLKKFEASSVSGDISVVLPYDLGFTLYFDSISGVVCSASFDIDSNTHTFIHGSGEAALKVNTISGSFYLEQE